MNVGNRNLYLQPGTRVRAKWWSCRAFRSVLPDVKDRWAQVTKGTKGTIVGIIEKAFSSAAGNRFYYAVKWDKIDDIFEVSAEKLYSEIEVIGD